MGASILIVAAVAAEARAERAVEEEAVVVGPECRWVLRWGCQG